MDKSNVFVGNNTIYYKTWHRLGIKYMKDIYDYSVKKIYTFDKLKVLYNVPNNVFKIFKSCAEHTKPLEITTETLKRSCPNQNDVVKDQMTKF